MINNNFFIGPPVWMSVCLSIHPSVSLAFLGGSPIFMRHFSSASVRPSCTISQELYIYGHNFWYTCVEWGNLQAFFLFFKILIFWVFRGLKGQKITYVTRQNDYMSRMFFPFFQNFDFSGVRRVKGQKTVQSDKNYVCCAPYLKNLASFTCHLWYTCVKW